MTHHRLLHKNKVAADRTARSHTLHSTRRKIAFKMIQLDALNNEGESMPVNVMMDDESDSTLFRESLARHLHLKGHRQTLFVECLVEEALTHFNSKYFELHRNRPHLEKL